MAPANKGADPDQGGEKSQNGASGEAQGARFPVARHDHAACVSDALAHSDALCRERSLRLTPNRRQVLEALVADHKPLSAYDIADRIDWQGRRGGPVQVYRALRFFEDLGLVHRIESLNAFVACSHYEEDHGAQFLVCTDCGRVAEASDRGVKREIGKLARQAGFEVHDPVIEIRGLCPDCGGTR